MDGNPFQALGAVTQQVYIPVQINQRGGSQAGGGIDMLNHLRGFAHEAAPFDGILRADFVTTPVLVADAPILDIVRRFISVGDTHARILALAFEVAVFHPVAHLFGSAGAGVGADIRFAANLTAQQDELVRAEGVGILHAPGLVEDGPAVGTDSLFPVVAGNKAAAGPTDDRGTYFLECFQDIGTESVFVGERGTGFKYAAIDLAMEVLKEMTIEHRIAFEKGTAGCDVQAHKSHPFINVTGVGIQCIALASCQISCGNIC